MGERRGWYSVGKEDKNVKRGERKTGKEDKRLSA